MTAALVILLSLLAGCATAPPTVTGPTLPLPELPPAPGRDGVVRLPGSAARAWSYRPDVAEPLGKIGKALFTETKLGARGRALVFAVVAARNRCLY